MRQTLSRRISRLLQNCYPVGSRAVLIEGKGALVAGGASGLGEATARALAREGAEVVIADLNAEKGEALAAEIGASFVAADVTDEDAVGAAVARAAEGGDGLRISVCCAGIGWAQRVTGKQGPHDLEIFSNVIKVNLIGTFNVLRLAATAMNQTEPDEGRARRLRQHRLDRRLRRADRPDRLRRLQGRHRRPHPAGRPRPRRAAASGLPRSPPASSTRRSWQRCRRSRATRSAPASPSRPASARPRNTRGWRSRSSPTRC